MHQLSVALNYICVCVCLLTVVMRQVEQDPYDGSHTVLYCLPHHSSV